LDVLYGRSAREEPLADDLTRLYSLHFLVVLLERVRPMKPVGHNRIA
jgi:hypothetical protein